MMLNKEICYNALLSRDPRFDGRFYTGVMSTGIYCRPICPARTPKSKNCCFFSSAASAEKAGFRPCLRCRPEASPGTPAWLGTSATVSRGLRLIAEGALDQGTVESLAQRLGMGTRHLRRLFHEHLGASPMEVAQTRRVHLAKKLLDETRLPITQVAFSAGFNSVRRFNAAMDKTYGISPSRLRKRSNRGASPEAMNGFLTLRLPFRTPFSWRSIIDYLLPRLIPYVEDIKKNTYRRTISMEGVQGMVAVKHVAKDSCLMLQVPVHDSHKLTVIVERIRNLFDLGADPETITRHLVRDFRLAKHVEARPGLRVPGVWDRFEWAVRVIIWQQITVKAATTLTGRMVKTYGAPFEANDGLNRLFPEPKALAEADLESIGLTSSRAKTIRSLAKRVITKTLLLDNPVGLDQAVQSLTSLPGIGQWTAHSIAMRSFKEPDAFPAGDLGLRRALATDNALINPKKLEEWAEAWRPWRSYAAMYLWMSNH